MKNLLLCVRPDIAECISEIHAMEDAPLLEKK